ncbi:glycoside hydrolase N-terminal domain-containing protein [Streptomyces sp. AS02]|uniref:glycosyl hydrolase family 95 catalytic domain-containing protein n=1 Tax=Streptomyces sp. AS02 TaxID=2938946 RepID=UPI0020205EF0|nr:glycoside hydrolase N-terminal domain-containing protein [Streptomyces sp. AS02]MCL8017232.1 glycoside hydrolase family 95 protein [Streptomyces sp. AS02]
MPSPAPATRTPRSIPERGIHDTSPATTWQDGFLTGNGEYGAVFHGTPELEKVIFNHHRLVLPNGTRAMTPPVLADRLEAVRDKALAGDYAGASGDLAAGWSLQWTQSYHPAYELHIATARGAAQAEDYRRATDFRTGEVTSKWTHQHGDWTRRGFASRADRVLVHELAPAADQSLDLTLRVHTALDGLPDDIRFTTRCQVADGEGHVNVRGVYPQGLGAYGYEGVTRVVAYGPDAAVRAEGTSLVVTGASRVLLLTKLDRYESATAWDSEPLRAELAALTPDYMALLARHTALHTELYDRSRLDLRIPEQDRALPVGQLIARQNADRSTLDLALLERLYDSGRYLLISSSGILPPRLTGLWTGSWSEAWAGDFTTDANVNLQVAGTTILDLAELLRGYTDLVLGQLDHWRTNARNLYGARGFLAPSRTDGEHGHMLHFDGEPFPGHTWTGGADWLLYPLLEYYEVTGDEKFLRESLAPVLMELALFYEDFLTRTDADGKVVFVPSFSMENTPANTGVHLSVNATGDIMAGRHALRAAVEAANALGVEQGAGEGVERWTVLLERLPDYRINADGALAEWSWPDLADRYDHRHVHHLYGAWPLHEITPEDTPDLIAPALRALELRGDENTSAHGSLHRALAAARLKDGDKVYANLLKILGSNMFFRSLMTSHNPELHIYNADAAHALPAVLAEALLYTRPGMLDLLPALPDRITRGTLTGLRARGRIRVHRLSWDLTEGTVGLSVTSETDQEVTLVSRRGLASVTTRARVGPSPLGAHAVGVSLSADDTIEIAVTLLPSFRDL